MRSLTVVVVLVLATMSAIGVSGTAASGQPAAAPLAMGLPPAAGLPLGTLQGKVEPGLGAAPGPRPPMERIAGSGRPVDDVRQAYPSGCPRLEYPRAVLCVAAGNLRAAEGPTTGSGHWRWLMRLAVIPGDGIGPEVIGEALKVLNEVAPDAETTPYDLGAARWHSTGELLPESVLNELRQHDAILLGAVGDPSVPSGILERGLLLRLRFELDHHVNLRPARLYPGVRSPVADPGTIDLIVVREGTEGPYAGNGGLLRKDTPHEIATEVSLNTAFGVERVVRDAVARASARPRRHLTLVHKTIVL